MNRKNTTTFNWTGTYRDKDREKDLLRRKSSRFIATFVAASWSDVAGVCGVGDYDEPSRDLTDMPIIVQLR